MEDTDLIQVAENLARRNKDRLSLEISDRQKEKADLIYWILNKLELSVEKWPAKASHMIAVRELATNHEELVLLRIGDATYLSQYVARNAFYAVMEEVAELLEGIVSSDYSYSVECCTNRYKAYLNVTLRCATEE